MATSYETDIAAWAHEQAELLRAGKLSAIDALNIAEEIEDVAKSERRALESRMAVLIGHLLKWKFQPSHRGTSWKATIRAQRTAIAHELKKAPSLKHTLEDEEWLTVVWQDALDLAQRETALHLPGQWIWAVSRVLDHDFWPD